MNNLEKAALDKAISFLKAGKFQFAVIDSDGTKHGDLEIVVKTERKRSPSKYPFGSVRQHFYPYVGNLQKDQAVEVPCGSFAPEDLRGSISAWACTNWGNGSHNTIIDKDANSILVFRTL